MSVSDPGAEERTGERITLFEAAWDRRDPNPSKNYGIHGVGLLMVFKGSLGAVQFRLSTGWLLPETLGLPGEYDWRTARRYGDALGEHNARLGYPSPTDLGYHSPRPMYEGQDPISEECEYVPGGGPCYYDGSGLNAGDPFYALLHGGSEGVWTFLEDYYAATFESSPLETSEVPA